MTYKSLVRKHGVVKAAKLWKAEKKAKKAGKAKPKKAAKRGTVRTFVAKGKTVTIVTGRKPAKRSAAKPAKRSAAKPAKRKSSKAQREYRALVKKYGVREAARMRQGEKSLAMSPARPSYKNYVKSFGVKEGGRLWREYKASVARDNLTMYSPKQEDFYGTSSYPKEEPWTPYNLPKAGSMRGRRRRRPGRMSGFLVPC